jgi:hypothetical protein
MSELQIADDIIEKIEMIAAREQRGVDDVLRSMVEKYVTQPEVEESADIEPNSNPLLGLLGLLDEYTNETDLSTTVQETLKKYSHPQYGWTKRDRTD